MRVGILIHKCSGGGAERVAGEISRLLDEQGMEVFFCTFFKEEEEYPYAGERLSFKEEKRGSATTLIKRIQWIRTIKREKKLDAMISLLPQANLINLITGGRAIVSFRNDPASLSSGYRAAFGLTLHLAEKAVAVSKGVEEELKREYPVLRGKTTTIYSPARFSPVENRTSRRIKRILAVGRLEEQKAHGRLIEAFAVLAKTRPELTLRIIGEGSQRVRLLEQAKQLGMESRVEILPFTAGIRQEYLDADLLVLASRHEGLSNVLLEALAMGLPVIATDCPYGSRELLAPATPVVERASRVEIHEFGVLSPLLTKEEETVEHLTRAMRRVLEDEELQARLMANGPKRLADFSGEEIGRVWRRLINQ